MVHCPACGRENPEDSTYCAYCGSAVERIDLRRMETLTAPERQQIRKEVAAGPRLERMPSKYWPIAALLVYIVGIIVVLAVFISAIVSRITEGYYHEGFIIDDIMMTYLVSAALVSFVTSLIFGTAVYLMLEGRKEHFNREVRLVNGIIRYVHKVADACETPLTLDPYAGVRFERETRDRSFKIRPGDLHSPALWAAVIIVAPTLGSLLAIPFYAQEYQEYALVVVPALLGMAILLLAFIYMMHRWTKDMESHDARWRKFAAATGIALHRLGYDVQRLPELRRLPNRSSAASVVLTIFFGMIAMAIWMYNIMDDQNMHSRRQRAFEQSFLDLIEPGSRR